MGTCPWRWLLIGIGTAAAVLFLDAGLATAQIITTMRPSEVVPSDPSAPRPAVPFFAGHVMVGAAAWEHGTDFYDQVVIDFHGGTLDNASRAGLILAGDFPLRLNDRVHTAVGGWYNRSARRVLHDPQHIFEGQIVPDRVFTDRSEYWSAYANVFYKQIGVQAGVIPGRFTQTLERTGAARTTLTRTPVDTTLFAVVRADLTDTFPKLAIMGGFGVYRYGARDAGLLGEGLQFAGTSLPASVAPSGFFNFSWVLTRHLAADFSAWGTGANSTQLNDTQARVTVGLGITF